MSNIKIKGEKIKKFGFLNGIIGLTGIFSSWQVCHGVCLSVVFLLSFVGITIAGMPLMFLTKWALPLWSIAFILYLITLFIYYKHKIFSENLLMFNGGLILIGLPFNFLKEYSFIYMAIGLTLVLLSIFSFIERRWKK